MSNYDFSDQFDIDAEFASSLLKNNFALLALVGSGDGPVGQTNKVEMDSLHYLMQRINDMTHDELKEIIIVEMERNEKLRSGSVSARGG